MLRRAGRPRQRDHLAVGHDQVVIGDVVGLALEDGAEPAGLVLGADGFDKGTVFAAEEMLVLATLDSLEVPLWEVFEVEGPQKGEVLPTEPR